MMKKVLVMGAMGQIGSELVVELRNRLGHERVVASDIRSNPDDSDLFELHDCTDAEKTFEIIKKYKIDTIFHLPALLSATAETYPQKAFDININGLYATLEVARQENCAVFTPSTIGAFGLSTPKDGTPQDTIMRPNTMYGVTKVAGELMCDYYFHRFGVDTRGVRYPGIISHKTLPGGGTTDYAVEIYYDAIKHGKYECYIDENSFLDMMFMPDAVNAAIAIMDADPEKLIHRNAFNITAMSFSPKIQAESIQKIIPQFEISYHVDPIRQSIADSWPNSMDDSAAREEWGWSPEYDLDRMSSVMINELNKKL